MEDEKQVTYPWLVYHAEKGYAAVRDEAQHKAYLDAGWTDAPAVPAVSAEAPVDPLAALEARVAALEALAKRKK